jgi:lipopolysaccharide export system permease protein
MKNHLLRFTPTFTLAVLGALFCAWLVPGETAEVRNHLLGFPDSDAPSHLFRPWVLGTLWFLPALATLVYACGSIMDRYITRQFAGIFGVCLGALITIWLLMDLSDKIGDFRESANAMHTMASFYGTRSPAVLLLLLPYSLLLAVLYCLGKLSGNREIIAMIQAGRSVIRITLPLILCGIFFSLLSLGLNYHWAPVSEGKQDEILSTAKGKTATEAVNVLYHAPANQRLWMIGAFPQDYHKGEALLNVEITTTRPDRSLERRLTAKRALWDRETHHWTFEGAVIGDFQPNEAPVFTTSPGPLVMESWPETPWQLIKPGLSPAYLGIPDLLTWLKARTNQQHHAEPAAYQTQLHYRLALPFACLVTVLLATPLGIHFTRRGPGGGVFLAVVLSAMMLLISSISISVGEAGLARPALAAWVPNLVFALLGAYLFRRRVTGQPIYLVLRRLFPATD